MTPSSYFTIPQVYNAMRESRGDRGPKTLENHKAIGSISNTGPDSLENQSDHKALIEIVKREYDQKIPQSQNTARPMTL